LLKIKPFSLFELFTAIIFEILRGIMKFIVFLLISSLLFAEQYPTFSQEEISKIEKKNGEISKNRILDFNKNLKRIQKLSKTKQLNALNFYLNQLLPQYDSIIDKQENYWATPKEFLITGYGDCEDYVIIKYFSLIKLGFDEKKLFLTVVKENYYGHYHMVLSYFPSKEKDPLFLDNLSFKILSLSQRTDLQAQTFINSTGVYKLQNGKLVKIAKRSLEYTELLTRIKKED